MTNREQILNSILHHTKTRLQPSKVCDGVGVFAIELIHKDEICFPDVGPDTIYIMWSELTDLSLPTKQYLQTMCNTDANGLYLSRTTNNINISYFVNHSTDPNVFHDLQLDRYIAMRDIQPGEELLCTYQNYELW